MPLFEFLHPDKSPQNARMPKRLNTLKRKKRQPTHTPHPHNKIPPKFPRIPPRSFAHTTIAHSKFPMCIDAKFPPTQQSTPKFHNALKSKVSDYLKRPSKFPPTQQSTPKFRNALKSKVSDYLKRPSKFPYTHEVREFLTIQRTPTKHPHPRSILGSLIASKIPTFQGEILHIGVSTNPPPTPPRTGGNPSVCVPKNA